MLSELPNIAVFFHYLFLKFIFIFYFWLLWVLFAVCGVSLVLASGGSSLVVVHWLLIAVAPLVAEHGL